MQVSTLAGVVSPGLVAPVALMRWRTWMRATTSSCSTSRHAFLHLWR